MNLQHHLLIGFPLRDRLLMLTNERGRTGMVGLEDDIDLSRSDGTIPDSSPAHLALTSGPEPGITDVNGWHLRIADY